MLNDNLGIVEPAACKQILQKAQTLEFNASCDAKTGALLRTLASSKPEGRLLELGTGVGYSTCWLLDGMAKAARLDSIELDLVLHDSARAVLGKDSRLTLHHSSVVEYLQNSDAYFDLIFADTFSGKFTDRELVLEHLAPGAFYIVDDLLPQANWPLDDHPLKVRSLIEELCSDNRLEVAKFNFASGIIIGVRR